MTTKLSRIHSHKAVMALTICISLQKRNTCPPRALLFQPFLVSLWFIVSSCVVMCCILFSHFYFVFTIQGKKWCYDDSTPLPAVQTIPSQDKKMSLLIDTRGVLNKGLPKFKIGGPPLYSTWSFLSLLLPSIFLMPDKCVFVI